LPGGLLVLARADREVGRGGLVGQAQLPVRGCSSGWAAGPGSRWCRRRRAAAKTMPLRSWISELAMAGCAAWVPVGRDERDPQNFWLSVVAALRRTIAVAALVGALSRRRTWTGGRSLIVEILVLLAGSRAPRLRPPGPGRRPSR